MIVSGSVVHGQATRPCGRRPVSEARCKLDGMSAEPYLVEDPNDPEVILRDLPEQERGQFLRQYHEAVDAAHDPAGYRRLQQVLHAWRLTVIATSQPGYYEELAAVRDGTAHTMAAEEAFPDWHERLAAARAHTP
jgi:hypothetical protein